MKQAVSVSGNWRTLQRGRCAHPACCSLAVKPIADAIPPSPFRAGFGLPRWDVYRAAHIAERSFRCSACFARMGTGRATSRRLMKSISMRTLVGMTRTLAKMSTCIFELRFALGGNASVIGRMPERVVHTLQTQIAGLRYTNSFTSDSAASSQGRSKRPPLHVSAEYSCRAWA